MTEQYNIFMKEVLHEHKDIVYIESERWKMFSLHC